MWNEKLAHLAAAYRSGVLTTGADAGYPASVRVQPQLDTARQIVTFATLPPYAAAWRGKACLLLHRHNEHLEDLHQLVLKGELVEEGGSVLFRVSEFLTANARDDTDDLPHAAAPLHMLQFLLLGRRKAAEYIAKRGAPWPPIPYEEIGRKMEGE